MWSRPDAFDKSSNRMMICPVLFNTDATRIWAGGGVAQCVAAATRRQPMGSDHTVKLFSNEYLHSLLPPTGFLVADQVPNSLEDSSLFNVSSQIDWRTPVGILTLLPAYRYTNTDSLTYDGLRYGQQTHSHQKSMEGRLSDTSGGG